MLPLCDYEKRKMFSSTFYKFKYVKPEKTLSGPLDVAQSQREREREKQRRRESPNYFAPPKHRSAITQSLCFAAGSRGRHRCSGEGTGGSGCRNAVDLVGREALSGRTPWISSTTLSGEASGMAMEAMLS
jgi:hypothetical protein